MKEKWGKEGNRKEEGEKEDYVNYDGREERKNNKGRRKEGKGG
jgi:hypothetical protein